MLESAHCIVVGIPAHFVRCEEHILQMSLACSYAQLQPIRIRSVESRSFDRPYILNEFAFCEQVSAILTGYR